MLAENSVICRYVHVTDCKTFGCTSSRFILSPSLLLEFLKELCVPLNITLEYFYTRISLFCIHPVLTNFTTKLLCKDYLPGLINILKSFSYRHSFWLRRSRIFNNMLHFIDPASYNTLTVDIHSVELEERLEDFQISDGFVVPATNSIQQEFCDQHVM